jgi:hypothetical protein
MSEAERARRVGLNEGVFRSVNESLSRSADGGRTGTDRLDLICECGDAACAERIRLRRDAYERLRADPLRFALVAGHDTPDVERVVEMHDAYWVVRKFGAEAERVAEETDPRSA